MGVFIEPPFWAQRYWSSAASHAVSVLVTPPTLEPLTVTEAKLRAGLAWADGDPRDALMAGFIAAARSVVEQRTGLALLTQTRDLYFDRLPIDRAGTARLPAQSLPLQQVISVKSTDSSGTVQTLDPSNYVVDVATARIGLSVTGSWPSDLRPMQPWVIRIISGWVDVAALRAAAPLLIHAVGLLVGHYATLGRDLGSVDTVTEVPFGFEDAIAPYCLVTVP